MFTFFRVSVSIAIATLFLLSLITLSDVFLHDNQLFYAILTIVTAVIFLVMGLVGIMIYKNFKNIWQSVLIEEQHAIKASVQRLLLIFGLIAVIATLFSLSLCMGLVNRMLDGMTLFG